MVALQAVAIASPLRPTSPAEYTWQMSPSRARHGPLSPPQQMSRTSSPGSHQLGWQATRRGSTGSCQASASRDPSPQHPAGTVSPPGSQQASPRQRLSLQELLQPPLGPQPTPAARTSAMSSPQGSRLQSPQESPRLTPLQSPSLMPSQSPTLGPHCVEQVTDASGLHQAQQALEQAREDETESAIAIPELETRLRGLVAQGTPSSNGSPNLTDVIPGLGTTVDQLGAIVQALGGGEKFAADLATMAACVGRFKDEAAAAQAQAAPEEQGPEAALGGMPGTPEPDMEVDESAADDVDDLDAAGEPTSAAARAARALGLDDPDLGPFAQLDDSQVEDSSVVGEDGEVLGPRNTDLLWTIIQYLCLLNSKQIPWVVGGDWNMDRAVLCQSNWANAVNAVTYVPTAATCRQTRPGTCIDYFVSSASLSQFLGREVSVDEEAATFPHLPVRLPSLAAPVTMWAKVPCEKRAAPATPPIGCARPPVFPWQAVMEVAGPQVNDRQSLVGLWDLVSEGIYFESQFLWDRAGPKAEAHFGNSEAPSIKWKKLAWAPPRRRSHRDGGANAWATALIWAMHLGKLRPWMRKLGHDLAASRVMRSQEKGRLRALKTRRRKFLALKGAAGRTVSRLVRTGAMPAAAHGAGVAGVSDTTLPHIRQFTATLADGKPHGGVTAYMIMHPDPLYDHVYDCTLHTAVRYAAWIWDARFSLDRLQRAWTFLRSKMRINPTWQSAKGPLSCTWLALLRVNWGMCSARAFVADLGDAISLLHTPPYDVKLSIIEGIPRRTRECDPAAFQRAAAAEWFLVHGASFAVVRSEAVGVACETAAKLAPESEALGSLEAGPSQPIGDALGPRKDLGHGPFQVPGWDGDPKTWRTYRRKALQYQEGTKRQDRYLCGPRLEAKLTGRAEVAGARTRPPDSEPPLDVELDPRTMEMGSRIWSATIDDDAEEELDDMPEVFPSIVRGWLMLARAGLDSTGRSAIVTATGGPLEAIAICDKLISTWEDDDLAERDGHARYTKAYTAQMGDDDRTWLDEADGEQGAGSFAAEQEHEEFEEEPDMAEANDVDIESYMAAQQEEAEALAAIHAAQRALRQAREAQADSRLSRGFYRGGRPGSQAKGGHWLQDCLDRHDPRLGAKMNNTPEASAKMATCPNELKFNLVAAMVAGQKSGDSPSEAMFAEQAILEGKGIFDLGCAETMGGERALDIVARKNLGKYGDARLRDVNLSYQPVYSFGNGENERAYGPVKFGITGAGNEGDIAINGFAKDVPILVSKKVVKKLGAVIDSDTGVAVFVELAPNAPVQLEESPDGGHCYMSLVDDILEHRVQDPVKLQNFRKISQHVSEWGRPDPAAFMGQVPFGADPSEEDG
ncbi:unnamed protein product [Prorocentrum cordatum]|nr:unnamed protein product [Polarella glacialis]